ncbi:MAG: HD domain-containing protein [Akkermansia sp.]|nr:HD domain-containing protein [Akkermansia sp.]
MKTQLNTEIALITNEDIRALVRATLDACPSCFWTMPAATTGKYHPAISLGEGGLIRHTRAVVRLACHLCDMEDIAPGTLDRDIILAAAILHDCCKKYDTEKYTAFMHPQRAADLLWQQATLLAANGEDALRDAAARTIGAIIACHMGRWNTNPRTGEQLPTPLTPMQRLVHTADFLASRKDITLDGIS